MFGIKKEVWQTAGIVLATIIVTAYVQRNIVAVPVVGGYLPK